MARWLTVEMVHDRAIAVSRLARAGDREAAFEMLEQLQSDFLCYASDPDAVGVAAVADAVQEVTTSLRNTHDLQSALRAA